jgi:hypothetical protein
LLTGTDNTSWNCISHLKPLAAIEADSFFDLGYLSHAQLEANGADGWVNSLTWVATRTSASTFTVPGDITGTIQKGTKLRFEDSGYKYAVVSSVTYSAGTGLSTVTIIVNTDYTIVGNPYSDPYGWPAYFNYAPTMTNVTLGNGTLVARYRVINSFQVALYIHLTFGTTTSLAGTSIQCSTPVTMTNALYTDIGSAVAWDTGTAPYHCRLWVLSSTNTYWVVLNVAGTYAYYVNATPTVPHTWASTDTLHTNAIINW